jgi:hypothetical protein
MAGRAGRPVTRIPAFSGRKCSHSNFACGRAQRRTAISLFGTYDVVEWWATPVEIASALARLKRMKELDSLDWAKATNLAKKLSRLWSIIQPRNVCARRRSNLWIASTCEPRTLFHWERLWNGVNTLLRTASFSPRIKSCEMRLYSPASMPSNCEFPTTSQRLRNRKWSSTRGIPPARPRPIPGHYPTACSRRSSQRSQLSRH